MNTPNLKLGPISIIPKRRKQMKALRMLSVLAWCGLGLVSAARASTISAGQTIVAGPVAFGGTLVAAAPSTIAGPLIFGSLTAGVFSDPQNVYCTGCLDFFYFLGNSGGEPITGIFAASFRDFPLNVGFSAVPGGIAPSTITREPDGNGILFSFAQGVGQGQFSDFLVIQTPANSYTFGSASVEARGGTFGVGGSGFQPTPEPASLIFVSSGLLGIAGIVKARYRTKRA